MSWVVAFTRAASPSTLTCSLTLPTGKLKSTVASWPTTSDDAGSHALGEAVLAGAHFILANRKRNQFVAPGLVGHRGAGDACVQALCGYSCAGYNGPGLVGDPAGYARRHLRTGRKRTEAQQRQHQRQAHGPVCYEQTSCLAPERETDGGSRYDPHSVRPEQPVDLVDLIESNRYCQTNSSREG